MSNTCAFTICAYNYLSKALALSESFKQFNPEIDFKIFLVGRKKPIKNFGVDIHFVEDIKIKDYEHFAFKYDVIEFSTYLKPVIFKFLFQSYSKVYYIDPDIMFFSSLSAVDQELDTCNAVLTPHTLKPIDDNNKPSDLDFSRFGAFNLGFAGLRNTENTRAFISWWEERLSKYGFYEPQSGMAVDQKWIDLAYIYFENFKKLKHLGCNVAFWNLHERRITKVESKYLINDCDELIFVHFSSYNKTNTRIIADKQNRFLPGSRPDFQMVSEDYFNLLCKCDSGLDATPYCYDYFIGGGRISNTLRRIYANMEDSFKSENLFAANSSIYNFALNKNLISKGYIRRNNFKDISSFPKIQNFIIYCLKFMLKILGPDKYYMLMRYMAYMSSIQNQSKMFKVESK